MPEPPPPNGVGWGLENNGCLVHLVKDIVSLEKTLLIS